MSLHGFADSLVALCRHPVRDSPAKTRRAPGSLFPSWLTRPRSRSPVLICRRSLVAVAGGPDNRAAFSNLDSNLMNASVAAAVFWRVISERVTGLYFFGDRFEDRREILLVGREVSASGQWDDPRNVQQSHGSLISKPGHIRRQRDRINRHLGVIRATYQVLLVGAVHVVEAVCDYNNNAAKPAAAAVARRSLEH